MKTKCYKNRSKCAIASILLVLVLTGIPATHALENTNEFPLNLLFSREDVPRIVENTKLPMFKQFWEETVATPLEKDGNFMREAFIYALTGNKKRGEAAKKEMLKVLDMKRWDHYVEDQKHTLGMLKGGRLTSWMSLSYDWLYDLLTPREREEILEQIADKGCAPCYLSLYGMRYPSSVKGWGFDAEQNLSFDVPDMSRWPYILGHNNFRAVSSGGFALGLFAVKDRDNRSDMWLEMLLDSFYRFADLYKADGSYDEGMSYCNFGTTYLIYLMEVVKRKLGIELFDAANFVGMMDCNLALLLPHHLEPGGSVNFGDAGNSLNSAIGFWVARKSRDGLSQYIAMNYPHSHDIFSLVYYDHTVKPVPPTGKDYFKKMDLDWIVTRTGYDMDDLVVAMRSGPPFNHEHADRNSILLKDYGEILLADHKHPTYDRNNPGWLLRTSIAHNTVVIDGKGHQYHNGEEGTNESKSFAKILRFGQRDGYDFWASDATQAYQLVNEDVETVTRTTLVFPDIRSIIVLDKFETEKNASSFTARWHVENSDGSGSCEASENGFTISRPHAKFFAVCAGSDGVVVTTEKLPLPKDMGLFPFIEVNQAEKSKNGMIVLAGSSLKRNENTPKIEIQGEDELWEITIKKNSALLKLNVYDVDRLPEFEVVEYNR